jgi:hypothetical protein
VKFDSLRLATSFFVGSIAAANLRPVSMPPSCRRSEQVLSGLFWIVGSKINDTGCGEPLFIILCAHPNERMLEGQVEEQPPVW